ncbi:MAG: hypothetical protein JSW01_04445 [Candidatus Bathyarchaeota archaeon]|nr:MAG: hypothetical protein JSW01_04445 [Candidatus Bathyarchaeota archaeon]
MRIRRSDSTIAFLISLMFLAQILTTAYAIQHESTVEDKIAALEARIDELEAEITTVRVIGFSVAFLALAIAVMIPIYPKFKQPAKK